MSKEPNGTTPELIVLGRDEAGKPRAARFPAGHDNLVAKAAKAMNLTVCKADGEAQWQHLKSAVKNSRAALRLRHGASQMKAEPFGILIFCTADPKVADAKARSKWARVLRFARRAKSTSQRLTDFIKSNGGLNECARRLARTR
jgi:hypothetical protein